MLARTIFACTKCWSNSLGNQSFYTLPTRHFLLSLRGGLRQKRPRPSRRSPDQHQKAPSPNEGHQSSRVMRRLTLTVIGGIAGTFMGCTYWQHRAFLSETRRLFLWDNGGSWIDKLKRQFRDVFHRNPGSQEVVFCTITACAIIFSGWKIPALRQFMTGNFVAYLGSANPVRSMILSTYSHITFPHLFLNCFIMLSFGSMVGEFMRKEEIAHFIFSSGLVSAYFSLALNALLRDVTRMSLGISGVLYAFAGYKCLLDPNSQFSLIPLNLVYPHSISGKHLIYGLLVFDLAGLIFFRHKSILDHAGHLGGLLFGISYAYSGRQLWTDQVNRWHRLTKGRD